MSDLYHSECIILLNQLFSMNHLNRSQMSSINPFVNLSDLLHQLTTQFQF